MEDAQGISNGYELLCFLKPLYPVGDRNSWWWPSFRSIEVCDGVEIKGATESAPDLALCIASILGQNTRYENAHTALVSLYSYLFESLESKLDPQAFEDTQGLEYPKLAYISRPDFQDSLLERLCKLEVGLLSSLIHKAGFHNQKAHRILLLANNAIADFGSFSAFAKGVSKEWLLAQKGIGNESASSILNYGLKREEMVADRYTQRLLASLGLEYDSYEDLQTFLRENLEKGKNLYDFDIPLAQLMARFHGKIVEHGKRARRKRDKNARP